LALLRALKDKQIIKVITGVRRSGKSTLLNQFSRLLQTELDVDERQIHAINFESLEYTGSLKYDEVYRELTKRFHPSKKNYVLLDEVQEVEDFERLLDGLMVRGDTDVYATGSNAHMLSSELATLISGRYLEIHVLPFSFSEYWEYVQNDYPQESRTELLSRYLTHSSFPQAVDLSLSTQVAEDRYLRDLYESVLTKDILKRRKITNQRAFENVLRFALANLGSALSPGNIAESLKRDGQSHNNKTVERYLLALEQSYVLYKANRFDIKGKRQLATQEKYYCVDVGLRRVLLGKKDFDDRGHILENVVYLELVRRGNQVWIGKSGNKEVDFVCKEPEGQLAYYQVAFSTASEETLKRELDPLRAIKDSYPKYVLSTDEFEFEQDGIRQVNVARWLLGE